MVLLFHTTQSVLRAEELLLEAGVDVDVVPRPEGVPGGLCGIALDVSTSMVTVVDQVLSAEDIAFDLYAGAFSVESSEPGPATDGGDDGVAVTPCE